MEDTQETKLETQKLELNNECIEQLKGLRKWTNILSIMGIVFIGIFLIITIFVITKPIISGHFGISFMPLLLVIAIYIFPVYYLFKFSLLSKKAISNFDNLSLSNAIKYLKMHYSFITIFLIITIVINIIVFLFFGSIGFHYFNY